jgi:DNA mismatch repair protein MutL
MASRIRILPSALADQIAAGEVVERPASVVKELVENAIDAGAQRIEVLVEDGGQGLLAVIDDGLGMAPDDAALCVQRHATSKISTREELFALRSLGFRGEALPSIASVSRFSLTTRTQAALAGTRVEIVGGSQPVIAEHAAPKGTRVEVRELFFNVPARLKFLKSRATESAHVTSVCLRAALAHPEITFRLVRDGRTVQEHLRASSPIARIAAAFPDDRLRVHEGSFEGAQLFAALAAPERARNGSANLHLYVNQRPVRDTALARAIAYAYGSVLPPGRFPVGVVQLTLDPSEVDVNVHPQKLEVRFARGRALLDALTRFLAKALGTSAWSGPAARNPGYWQARLAADGGTLGGPTTSSAGALSADPWQLAGAAPSDMADRVAERVDTTPDDRLAAATDAPRLLGARGFFASLRPLGQAQRTFLVCEGETALYVIDQHAADERVRFDALRRAHQQRSVRAQDLLFPERVECSELEAQAIEEHAGELQRFGLPCSRLGPTTVIVSGIPALLRRAPPARLLRDLLAELSRGGERAFSDALDMALATMACHAAVRAGDALSAEEIAELLRSLDDVSDFQGHCPHGRPIVCTLGWDELARQLGR